MTKRWTEVELEMLGADKGFLPAAYWPMQLVIIESPYAGEIEANVEYARACMRDSLNRGEAPIASHLLYTQPGILRDDHPEERQWGIDAGLAWRRVADRAAFYEDRNWSGGMLAARKLYREEGFPYEVRNLAGEVTERFPAIADRSPSGPRPKGSVHESGGAEGNRTNPVGHLLHKRSD